MNRRSFLSSCLALAAAPAIVRADSLMRIVPRGVAIVGAIEGSSTYVLSGPLSNGVREVLVFSAAHDEQTRLKVMEYLERKRTGIADRDHLVAHYRAQEPVTLQPLIWTAAHE